MTLPLPSPIVSATSLWRRRELIWALLKRDVVGRYRGSAMGLFWSALNPLLMLAVYTVFFGEVFVSKWGNPQGDRSDFALILFVGLLLHGFLAECIARAPQLIVGNPNYVTKVVFPLDTLPVVTVGVAAFHFTIGILIWSAWYLLAKHGFYATAPLIVIVFAPLALMALGIAWILASLGVYLRDVGQVVPFVNAVLLFASPVFYPISALPAQYAAIVRLSPLTLPIEQARDVLVFGTLPDWGAYGIYTAVALSVAYIGYLWFYGTRKGFADVL
jgi:lipopolysaccharide transport system permease protein